MRLSIWRNVKLKGFANFLFEFFIDVKPGFHMVVSSRWVSLTVFHSHWSIWFFGNYCQLLVVFHGRWQSFVVVNSLSKSSFKLLLLVPNLLTASHWRSFRIVGGRQRYFVLFPIWHNETTGSLAVFRAVASGGGGNCPPKPADIFFKTPKFKSKVTCWLIFI